MIYAIVAEILLIIEQAVKYWALLKLPLGGPETEFIPGVIDLIRVHNYGAAFGILENQRWLLVGVAVLFSAVVVFMIARRHIRGSFGRWTGILIVVGALGNAIDRALYGYVIDMFRFSFFKSFPVFNVADIFVVVGGIAFCLYVIFHREDEKGDGEAPERLPEDAAARPRGGVREEQKPFGRLNVSAATEREVAAIDPETGRIPGTAPVKRPRPAPPAEPSRPAVEEFTDPRPRRPAERRPQQAPAPQRPAAARPRPPAQGQGARKPAPQAGPAPAPRRPAAPTPQPRPEPRREAPAPRPAPKKALNETEALPEFSLEDILAEFSDN